MCAGCRRKLALTRPAR
ncbi:MAG: hypothetical protein EOO80_16865 [Oxalobacteraceae bacterium]|nr:MAG: hypothetical protein EOO80_16865 [Oxalobacteraceae bacterium]